MAIEEFIGSHPSRTTVQVPVTVGRSVSRRFRLHVDPATEATTLLRAGYATLPIVAGLDKFAGLLGDWETYLAPRVANALPIHPRTFMRLVGVTEIVAGTLVAVRPQVGAYVVAGWLGGIIGNFLVSRRGYDVALRDFGLMVGAVALARLSRKRRG